MAAAGTRLGPRPHRRLGLWMALLGLLAGAPMAAPSPADAAEAAQRQARRNEAATNTAAAQRDTRDTAANRTPAAAGRARRPAEAAAAPQPRSVAPALDPPPARSGAAGAAPVPATNLQPPRGDLVPQPDLAFGVPGPREFGAGATRRGGDPSPDAREVADRAGALPAPGFMLRLPF
jgi:hypothetical protein